jgi:uncharacterized protein (TIGR02996 family)
MSDGDALLAAIVAHPDEDTPRLVYADWLDEHGRSARAEFIRVQIEIARTEQLPRAELDRFVALFKRNQELIDTRRAELLGPLAILSADVRVEFRRGFVSEVTLSAFGFNQHRPTIATVRPLPRVAVNDSPRVSRGFLGFDGLSQAADPQLVAEVESVPTEFESQPWEAGDYGAWNGPTWARLERLGIACCRIGDDGVLHFLTGTALPVLTDLDLSSNDLTDAVIDGLLASAMPKQLKRVVLGGNEITDAGAIELARRWPTGVADRLVHLDLRGTPIGPVGQRALLNRFGSRVALF